MAKEKQEKVFQTPQEEIKFLKKQLAALKGAQSKKDEKIKSMNETNSDLNKSIEALLHKKEENEKIIAGLESQVGTLKEEIQKRDKSIKEADEDLEHYKKAVSDIIEMPWYKRIFL